MSDAPSPWEQASAARTDWQRADGALNHLRSIHDALSALRDALARNVAGAREVDEATAAVARLDAADPDALAFVVEPVMPGDRTLADAFHHGRAITSPATDVATALAGFAGGDGFAPLRDAVSAVVAPPEGPMAIDGTALDQIVTLFGLAVEAGIRYREDREDALQSALADAYDALEEPLPDLDDQPMALLPVRMETRFVDSEGGTDGDPVELLVRVYPDQIHTDSHEAELTEREVVWGQNFWATLWYARHPDPSVVPDDPVYQYLDRLPNERLRERVADIDPANFSDDHHDRYGELRDRAWGQLLDRFGRERAAYVVHMTEPTDDDLARDLRTRPRTPSSLFGPATDGGEDDEDDWAIDAGDDEGEDDGWTLADDESGEGSETVDLSGDDGSERIDASGDDGDGADTIDRSAAFEGTDSGTGVGGEADATIGGTAGDDEVDLNAAAHGTAADRDLRDPTQDLPRELPALSFPDVPRRPESWTKQPRAKLLPDRWIAVAEWETPTGTAKRTAVAGDPVCDPLATGPSPESVAGEELGGDDDGPDDAPGQVAPDGAEWMTDFAAAEDAGMALRLPLATLAGFDAGRGFDRVSVVGVKGSLDADAGADALESLLEAHHYTDGLSVLPGGTPTNHHDASADAGDDLPGVEAATGRALVTDGDRSDGDLLARALSIDPDDGEDHVFAHVENADGTQQRDARHMNSALWPATLGYSLANVFVDSEVAGLDGAATGRAAVPGSGDGPPGLAAGPTRNTVEGHLLWLDAYRRHFVRYVRGRGPFPTLRVGDQPYGVLPATAVDAERDLSLIDPTLLADLGGSSVDLDGLEAEGTTVESLVGSGVEPQVLVEQGASPDDVLAAGADPKRLVSGGVDPETVLDASGLAPEGLLQDGIGHLATSRLTADRLEAAGVPVEDLRGAGITTRALARGEVTDDQLADLGVTTESVAEAVLPEEARALGLTPAALERAGVTPATLLRGEFSAEQVEALGLDTRTVADAVLPDAVRELGITPKTIEDAGISPPALLNGDVSVADLEDAGVTTETLADALLPQSVKEFGVTPETIADSGIGVADLFNGDVGLDQLEAAGLNTANFADAVLPQSFRDAGITPQSLEDAGITPDAVLNGAVTPDDLVAAGITPDALAAAGVLPDALADVGDAIGDLLDSGLDPSVLLDRGLSPQTLIDAGVTPDLLVEAGLAPKHLVDAGVDAVELVTHNAGSIEELLSAGASPADLARAGATASDLAGGDVPVEDLVQTGMTALDLLSAGADALGVAQGGARPSHLREADVGAGTLREAGKAAGSLRVAGYTAEEALEAGYTASELLNGGYSPEELTAAGVDPETAGGGGRDVATMLAAGHPPEELRAAGYAADRLLEGGLEPSDLVTAGYTAGELADAGLSTEDLVGSGLDAGALRAAGLDLDSLRAAGVDPATLREYGASAQALLEAGEDPQALLDAGFDSVELEVAGVDVDALAEDAVEGDLGTDDVVDAAVDGLQYAATVLESPEQAERDAYSFSFDPALPTLTDGPRSAAGDAGESGDDESAASDGGVGAAGVPIVRPLSVDDRLGGRLRTQIGGLAAVWDEGVEGLPFGGSVEEDALLNALKREAVATDVRQRTMVYAGETRSGLADEIASAVERYFLPDHRAAVERVFGTAGLTGRDTRVDSLYPTDATRDEAVADMRARDRDGGLRTFYTTHLSQPSMGIIPPHETVDADIGLFIDVLLGSAVSDVHELGDVVNPLTFSFDTSMLDLSKDEWYGLDAADQRRRIVAAIENADDPADFARRLTNADPTGDEQGYAKLLNLGDNEAEFGDSGVLRSLLRILLQHGLLNEYLAARRRLGAAYDDLPSPLVDPAVAPDEEPTLMDTLWDEAPDALRAHPDIDDTGDIYYEGCLTAAATNYGTTTSIDPRLSEFADSLRYLSGLEPSTLADLTHETLDLASHRLDAWWTSVATKDLFELREAQGTIDPEGGLDAEKWRGADTEVPRATVDPALLSHVSTANLSGPLGGDGSADGSAGVSGGSADGSAGSGANDQTTGGAPFGDLDTSAVRDVGEAAEGDAGGTAEGDAGGLSGGDTTGTTGGGTTDDSGAATDAAPRAFDPAALEGIDLSGIADGATDGDSSTDGGFDPFDPGITGSGDGTADDAEDGTADDAGNGTAGGTANDRSTGDGAQSGSGSGNGAGQSAGGGAGQSAGGESVIDPGALADLPDVATRGGTVDPSAVDDRAASEPGLYVGGYGFVENLSVDREGQDGPGYIHAPSEQHAATAAILNSGAAAHEADEGENPLATDLSAARVRAGRRLLDGVRRGQSLGELLGYRIERRMHERTLEDDEPDLMQYADVFRAEFPQRLDKLTRPDETRTAAKDDRRDDLAVRDALDGLAFVKGFEDYPWGRGDALPGAGSPVHDALADIVAALRDDLDAVADLLTAESVHQLGQGNFDRAGGSVEALARGATLPDPEVVQTPRTETGLTHRQFVLLGADATATGEASPRTAAAPTVGAWVETLLPDAADVECTATYRWTTAEPDASGEERTVEHSESAWLSLDALALGPLDVLLLFGASREETRTELEQRLVYHLLRRRPTEPAVPADATVELALTEPRHDDAISVADLLELARSVREVVQAARPATASDLAHPGDAAGEGYDATTAETLAERANAAQDALHGAAAAIDERLALLDSSHAAGDGLADVSTPATSETASDGGSPAGTAWSNLDGAIHLPPVNAPALDVPWLDAGPTLTEQVDGLVDAVEGVAADVPLAAVETTAGDLDGVALRSELASFAADLPAGPTTRETATADHVVNAASDQPIDGRLGQPVRVPDADGSNGDSPSDGDAGGAGDGSSSGGNASGSDDTAGSSGQGDGEGGATKDDGMDPSTSGPTTWTPGRQELEGGIGGVASTTGETVAMDEAVHVDQSDATWFDEALPSVTVDSGLFGGSDGGDGGSSGGSDGESAGDSDEESTGDSDGTSSAGTGGTGDGTGGTGQSAAAVDWSTATATVTAWGTDGLAYFERSATATPYSNGRFDVTLDFSGVDPGTAFQVVATVDGTVVYSASGRVVDADAGTDDARSTLREDCPTLRGLGWLRARQSLLSAEDGPTGALVAAHDAVADWDALRDERDAVDPTDSTVTEAQLGAIDDVLALEGIDPRTVPERVDRAVAPVAALGLDRVVDVTAGEDGDDPDAVTYWVGESPAMGSVRARIRRTLDDPALYNDGVAPWLLKYDHGSAARLAALDDGADVAAYLDAFLAQPAWVVRYLDRKLADPAALVRDLTAWLYAPADLEDADALASALTDLAAVLPDRPALSSLFDGLPTGNEPDRLAAFAAHLRTLAGELGTPSPSAPGAGDAGTDFDDAAATALTDLTAAARTQRTALEQITDGPPAPRAVRTVVLERLREPMTLAASYGVFGGTPTDADGATPAAEDALVEQARALLDRLRTRLIEGAALDPRIEDGLAGRPVPQRVEDQTDRLRALFGEGFPVLPPFAPANPGELEATFTDDGLVPDEHSLAPETWLQRSAAHRERVDGFREARTLAETVAGTLTPSLSIGQVPFEPGDTWVGVEDVDPLPGRVSLVAQFGPGVGPATAGDRLTGLYVDEWNEAVPSASETTGLALRYDDPGNRAPQSVLLVPPPGDEPWSLDHLAATVAETSEYAKRRAVDLGDLPADATHVFPALTFAQGGGVHRPTPSVNFGMVAWYDSDLVAPLLPPDYSFVGGLSGFGGGGGGGE